MPGQTDDGSSPNVSVKQNTVRGALKILIPLFITYLVFALSIFLIFIPQQRRQLKEQKKEGILHLTDSTISLLSGYHARVQRGEIPLETAQKEAVNQIRHLRYGPEGKDYFWINDFHPFMVMHPYRPDLDGRDLTGFRDSQGNHPFVAMVEVVMRNNGGYVNYFWQWKDTPEKIVPKLSYVKGFPEWGWIIGTGIYEEDIARDISLITDKFIRIFAHILIFMILLSLYISGQVFRIQQKRHKAEQARQLDALRLEKLFELSRLTGQSLNTITEFALEEAITLTKSRIGYLAFMSEDETRLTMHTWSEEAMKLCEVRDKPLVYEAEKTGLWARAARTRRPEVINDYPNTTAPDKKGCPRGHVGISRMMSIPVFEGDRIVALAGVGNKQVDYDASDIRQLRLMMDGMWQILQKSRAERRLKESEARYRILAENATDVIWILDIADFRFSYVSPAIQNLLGYLPEEILGKEMGGRMDPASLEKVSDLIVDELARDKQPGLDPNRTSTIQVALLNRREERVWAEIAARFLRTPEGRPDRILGVARDITHRKALEQQLREANTDLRLAQRIAGVGSWIIDTETGQRTWSEEVFRIFERTLEQGPATFDDLKARYYRGKWWDIFNRAVTDAKTRGTPYDIHLKLSLGAGRFKWIHAICKPEPKSGGHHYTLRGTLQDITEQKKLEERIRQSQKMEALGTLAGGIAHDFNNILSSMMGFTELVKLRLAHDPDSIEKLDQVLAGGLRARDLVKHILVFSRKADVQKSPVRLGPLLKESLKFLRASLPPNIEIRQDLPAADRMVLADPTQMHQVLMNLFTNAAHAMKETGGAIDVRLTTAEIFENGDMPTADATPGRYLKLAINDTGPGISRADMGKIFEPFFTTKPRGEGTGMGLAMVYGIIREMGGHIRVDSEAGMGATFHILLPEQHGTDAPDHDGAPPSLPRGKGEILLVDDEPGIIAWTTQLLERLGYGVRGYENSTEALAAFNRAPGSFDLVLTDLAMPGLTGPDLAKQIKQRRPDLPIVLCTGFSESLTAENIREHGICDMVMKPVIAGELARAVRNAITAPGEEPHQ